MKNLFMITTIALTTWLSNPTELMAQQMSSYESYRATLPSNEQAILENLVNGEQPTAIISVSGTTTYGNGPSNVLDVNASDFGLIDFSNDVISEVKLIRIRYNSPSDYSQGLDLTGASQLSQLSGVLILSGISAGPAQLDNALQNVPQGVATFYSISIPE